MEIIYVLSYSLAGLCKISEVQALGVFSLALKDGSKKMDALSYNDCRDVIQVQLKARLVKMNIANVDSVIAEMLKLLAQKQSLFVMAVHK